MTDLQAHVEAPGRAELVKQVSEKIKETGVDYIYYQFISVTGRIVGKGIPAMHWERLAEKGFQLVYGSTANLFVDRHGEYIGYGPESSELVGIPDPETFCQLPWDKRIGRVFCTLFRNREERENPGGALTSDCRGNLRRIHNEFQDKHGLDMRCGTEPEMMWLKRGEDGKMSGGVTKPNCYHIDQFEELRPSFMKVIEYSIQMGLDIIQGDHENAAGQLELNTQFDDVLRNADRLHRSRAKITSSPASCPSHSWVSRLQAVTTTCRCGVVAKTWLTSWVWNPCRVWKAPSATVSAVRILSCPTPLSMSVHQARSDCSLSVVSSSTSAR